MYINIMATIIVAILVGVPMEEVMVKKDTEVTNTPRMRFSNKKEMMKYLREWQHRLFLDDWIIDAELVDELVDNDGNECWGLNNLEIVGRSSLIKLRKYNEDKDPRAVRKYCVEQTLVHELLHCIYNWLVKDGNNHDAVYFDTMDHQQLDKMADALLMAKYNIPFEFFLNKKD